MPPPVPPPSVPPVGNPRVRVVGSFEELVAARFGDGVNALCWPRALEGDFEEIVARLGPADGEEITTLDEDRLRALDLSAAGRVAAERLIADLRLLREHGLAPVLDCIRAYARDEAPQAVPTDVYSFHADSAPVEADTWLCSYTEAASEGLRNEDALQCIEIPETRAALRREFGGEEGAAFAEYLAENCFDLHYVAKPGAQPYSFGLGNLWRIAVAYPGCPVPPCVHRAPETAPGRPARLLLIS